jgi:DNA-directed RNA polymerase subunit RPC12/RpoP
MNSIECPRCGRSLDPIRNIDQLRRLKIDPDAELWCAECQARWRMKPAPATQVKQKDTNSAA